MKRLSLVLLIVSLALVGLFSQIAPAPAATAEERTVLLGQKSTLLQGIISQINELIAKRERLVGQILLLQELEKLAPAEVEEEKAEVLEAECEDCEEEVEESVEEKEQ